MNHSNEKRIIYIDYIETIAIIMVVFCHGLVIGESVLANILLQLTTTIAVPLFFMANGTLLLKDNNFSFSRHIKKTFLVLGSLLSWKILYFLAMLIRDYSAYSKLSFRDLLCFLSGQHIEEPYIPTEHFWFIYTLLAIYIVFPLIKVTYDNDKKIIKYIMIVLFFFVNVFTEVNTTCNLLLERYGMKTIDLSILKSQLFPFAQGSNYLIFFLLGVFLHERFYSKKQRKQTIILVMIAAVSFAIMLFQKYIQQGTLAGEWVRLAGDYQRITTLIMATAIYALFASLDYTNTTINKITVFVSKRTMNIFSVHYLLCMMYIWYIIPIFPYKTVLTHSLRTIAILFISIVITEPLTYIPGVSKVLGIKPDNYKKLNRTSF